MSFLDTAEDLIDKKNLLPLIPTVPEGKYPTVYLTMKEFLRLSSYDCSLPTFHTSWLEPGRMWRRNVNGYSRPKKPDRWLIGKWKRVPRRTGETEDMAAVHWYRPEARPEGEKS